jgi:hypothetical protein
MGPSPCGGGNWFMQEPVDGDKSVMFFWWLRLIGIKNYQSRSTL